VLINDAMSASEIVEKYNKQEELRCPFPTGMVQVFLQRLLLNMQVLADHVRTIKNGSGVKYLLPVKSDAYGCGMLPVAHFVQYKDACDYLGVAHIGEARQLRENGITMSVLVMGQTRCRKQEVDYAITHDIEITLWDVATTTYVNERAQECEKKIRVHLAVDSGMGREGVLEKDLVDVVETLHSAQSVELVGVSTHFSASDSVMSDDIAFTRKQMRRFESVRKLVCEKFSGRHIIFHAANSGARIGFLDSIFDMIRPGIASYGYAEGGEKKLHLQPVMDVVSEITAIKSFPVDHVVGYGRTYVTSNSGERIATVPLGYGDGISRSLSNLMTPLVRGEKVQSVGRISMDQFSVRVGEAVRVGDEVVVIGKGHDCKNDAQDIAALTGTIPYEVLCRIGNATRMRHVYLLREQNL
jgi:alanine racemase